MKNIFIHRETMYKVNASNYSEFCQWSMKRFVYKITFSTHFTTISAQHAYGVLTLAERTHGINNKKKKI